MRNTFLVFLIALVCASTGYLVPRAARGQVGDASVSAGPVAQEPPRLNFMDRRMASCLAIDLQTGVELAQWAAAHASDASVKKHAQRMAAEGIAFLKLLEERTDGRATQALRNSVEERAGEPAGTDDAGGAATSAPPQKRSRLSVLNAEKVLMQMKLEIAEDSAASLRSRMESRPEKDVDHYYVAGELFRQVQMLSTLKVLRKYTSAAFAPILDDAIQTTDRQLADTVSVLSQVGRPDALPILPPPVVAEK